MTITPTATGGSRRRRKGDRVEREIVELHRGLGLRAERVPLSGAQRYRNSSHDIDVYPFGAESAPLVCEVKSRKSGAGFITLKSWLGEFDVLFLKRNNTNPLVCLSWRTWKLLLSQVRR